MVHSHLKLVVALQVCEISSPYTGLMIFVIRRPVEQVAVMALFSETLLVVSTGGGL